MPVSGDLHEVGLLAIKPVSPSRSPAAVLLSLLQSQMSSRAALDPIISTFPTRTTDPHDKVSPSDSGIDMNADKCLPGPFACTPSEGVKFHLVNSRTFTFRYSPHITLPRQSSPSYVMARWDFKISFNQQPLFAMQYACAFLSIVRTFRSEYEQASFLYIPSCHIEQSGRNWDTARRIIRDRDCAN
jgi:hypothetical protein